MRIVIGEGSCGIAAGAEKVREALLNCDLGDARVSITGCIGMCYLEPIVDIYEDGRLKGRIPEGEAVGAVVSAVKKRIAAENSD